MGNKSCCCASENKEANIGNITEYAKPQNIQLGTGFHRNDSEKTGFAEKVHEPPLNIAKPIHLKEMNHPNSIVRKVL